MQSRKTIVSLLLIAFALIALAGCASPPPAPPPVATQPQAATAASTTAAAATNTVPAQVTQANLTIGLAVHADPATDQFWSVVVKGAKDASATYGITLKSGGNSDPKQQSQLIDNYVAAKVDGIIVSMANPDALKDSITKAVAAGIPVITINSGASRSKEFGALAHVGQTERVAGQGAGDRLNSAGVKNVLCVIHEEANVGLEDRCAGLKDTFKGTVQNFSVASTGTKDVKGTLTALQNKLTADKTIDAILTLNPTIAIAARDAIKATGGSQKLATFDLSPDVIDAINNGEILFAIDQQQYLQGYLPIVMIYLYKTNLNTVGGGQPVLTGPGFVDKSNASQVKALAAKGTR
ncbi:MAG: sugar ABC transporter substrate-binding protein [Chloroflexi bacterium]|nr:sugar ABC transporter substrate-binding protein [Chloroflexota bacterium]MCL5952516.1 sugar ABC transporter substrate-binding protein [Chloroflexota bacterium]